VFSDSEMTPGHSHHVRSCKSCRERYTEEYPISNTECPMALCCSSVCAAWRKTVCGKPFISRRGRRNREQHGMANVQFSLSQHGRASILASRLLGIVALHIQSTISNQQLQGHPCAAMSHRSRQQGRNTATKTHKTHKNEARCWFWSNSDVSAPDAHS